MKRFLYIFLLVLAVSSCKREEEKLRLIKVTEFSSSKVTDTALAEVIRIKTGIDIKIDYTISSDFALKQLEEKRTDFVILPNNNISDNMDFRTLVPLLPRVLMILTSKEASSMTPKELFEKGTVYFEDRSRLDSLLFEKLFYNFNIDKTRIRSRRAEDLKFDDSSDILKVYVGITHLKNRTVMNLTSSTWHFYSMGNVDFYGKGSRIEGFTMMNTSTYPVIIPMSVYQGKPKRSVLTFAINDVLISRSDLHKKIAYKITKAIIENKQMLIQLNNIYSLLNFDFDNQVLAYPVHRGSKEYINRDKPPVWYKYVSMIWPIISISVVIFGVITSFRQKLKRRKKQNIRMYYKHLLKIRDKTEETNDIDSFVEILKELRKLRSEALESLAQRKLDSGESFNIFLAMYNDVRDDLSGKIKKLRQEEIKNKDQKK